MDAFDTLGIEPSFSLDLSELARRQLELSSALHPDKFVGRAKSERRQALGRAIDVNEAHRSLKDPLTRATLLFERLGISQQEGTEPPASPLLLMEMMEVRENLRAAGRSGKLEVVEELSNKMRARQRESLDELTKAFDSALQSGVSKGSVEAVTLHQKVGELRYFQRFFDEADAILDEL